MFYVGVKEESQEEGDTEEGKSQSNNEAKWYLALIHYLTFSWLHFLIHMLPHFEINSSLLIYLLN